MAGATCCPQHPGTNWFIDLPCWAQSEEDEDEPVAANDHQALLLLATSMDNSDTLWDHLFEDESQQSTLQSALAQYFVQLRGNDAGDSVNRQREAFMARWIARAMQQNNGNVLVVCGGWHALHWKNCGANILRKRKPGYPHYRMQ